MCFCVGLVVLGFWGFGGLFLLWFFIVFVCIGCFCVCLVYRRGFLVVKGFDFMFVLVLGCCRRMWV